MPDLRGGFDILLDRLVSKLETYATEQAAVDPAYAYGVHPDRYREEGTSEEAGVYLYLNSIDPQPQRSGAYGHYAYDVEYSIEMIARARGRSTADGYTDADRRAGARLRYLIQQVLTAIDPARDPDLGMPRGTIAGIAMPRLDVLPPEPQHGERPVAAARLTLRVGISWEPTRVEGSPLTEIYADAGLWSADITLGG